VRASQDARELPRRTDPLMSGDGTTPRPQSCA
jgi:hypothetical protein